MNEVPFPDGFPKVYDYQDIRARVLNDRLPLDHPDFIKEVIVKDFFDRPKSRTLHFKNSVWQQNYEYGLTLTGTTFTIYPWKRIDV